MSQIKIFLNFFFLIYFDLLNYFNFALEYKEWRRIQSFEKIAFKFLDFSFLQKNLNFEYENFYQREKKYFTVKNHQNY